MTKMCFHCKNSYTVLPGIFDAGFFVCGQRFDTAGKKTPGRLNLPGALISYGLFLIFIVNLSETVEINF